MPLPDDAVLTLIARELNREGDDAFYNTLALQWDFYEPEGGVSQRLRYLYTKKAAIDALRGGAWEEMDWQEGDVHESGNQKSLNLQRLTDDVENEIKRVLNSLGGARAGELTTTAPVQVDGTLYSDPNDRRYRGDPLRRR